MIRATRARYLDIGPATVAMAVLSALVGCGHSAVLVPFIETTQYQCEHGGIRQGAAICGREEEDHVPCGPGRFGFPAELTRLTLPSKSLAVRLGVAHACALGTDGSVSCWGDNSLGQAGRQDAARDCVPRRVGLPSEGARALDLAGSVSCALVDGSGIWCWGGRASLTRRSEDGMVPAYPTLAYTDPSVVDVTVGSRRVCFAGSAGLSCWGQVGWRSELVPERQRIAVQLGVLEPLTLIPAAPLRAGCDQAFETRSSEELACTACGSEVNCVALAPAATWRFPRPNESLSSEGYPMDERRPAGSAWTVLRRNVCYAIGSAVECPGLFPTAALGVGEVHTLDAFGETLCAGGSQGALCLRMDGDGWVRESVAYAIPTDSVAVSEGAVCAVDAGGDVWCGGWAAPMLHTAGGVAAGARSVLQGDEWMPPTLVAPERGPSAPE